MSFKLVIECDEPGCTQEHPYAHRCVKINEKITMDARYKAFSLGWVEIDGKDFCPRCATKHPT